MKNKLNVRLIKNRRLISTPGGYNGEVMVIQRSCLTSTSAFETAWREHGADTMAFYFQTTDEEILAIEQMVASGRADEAAQLAHRAMGASALFGFMRLSDLFRRVEKLAHEKHVHDVAPLIEQIKSEWDLLQQIFQSHQASPAKPLAS